MNHLNYIDERQPDEGVVISNDKIIRSHSTRNLIREKTMVPMPSMYYDVKRGAHRGISGYCYLHISNRRVGFTCIVVCILNHICLSIITRRMVEFSDMMTRHTGI